MIDFGVWQGRLSPVIRPPRGNQAGDRQSQTFHGPWKIGKVSISRHLWTDDTSAGQAVYRNIRKRCVRGDGCNHLRWSDATRLVA